MVCCAPENTAPITPLYVPTLPSAMVEPFEAAPPPPPPDETLELAAVRAPGLLALAPPEPAWPVGPLASAPDEHWVVEVVVEEAAEPPAALVVVVVDFVLPPPAGLVVVVVVVDDEHGALPPPRAWAPVPPTTLEPALPTPPCTIGLWAADSMADCESRLPHPAKSRATHASARPPTHDRCRSWRMRPFTPGVPLVRTAPR
jgi:hypothetical protein